jgi:hypothetical protein
MERDMTQKQFDDALQRRGMEKTGFMGYVKLGGGLEVSMYNCGSNRRRDRLAWLIARQKEWQAEQERNATPAA